MKIRRKREWKLIGKIRRSAKCAGAATVLDVMPTPADSVTNVVMRTHQRLRHLVDDMPSRGITVEVDRDSLTITLRDLDGRIVHKERVAIDTDEDAGSETAAHAGR